MGRTRRGRRRQRQLNLQKLPYLLKGGQMIKLMPWRRRPIMPRRTRRRLIREQGGSWQILRGRKKARKVMDKLAKITKLKEEVASGKQLEKNQLEMIAKEKDLTEELKMLQL